MVSSIGSLSVSSQYNLLFFQQQSSSTLVSNSSTSGGISGSGFQSFGVQQFSSQSFFVLIQSQQASFSPDDPSFYYHQGDFQNAFQNLLHGLQSGNLDIAKQTYAQISELNAGHHGITYDSIGVPTSVQKLLYKIGQSLADDDLTSAQRAAFPVGRPLPDVYQPGRFEDDFQNLLQATASDDLSSARQAFSDISRLNDFYTLNSIGVPPPLQNILDQVGHYLESYNLDGVKQALFA